MGKKNKQGSLGQALIKNRFRNTKRGSNADPFLHGPPVQENDTPEYINLQSVTEESSFQDFLSTAQLAGTEFQAEKLNVKFLSLNSEVDKEEQIRIAKTQEDNREFLNIPRRPKWDESTTANDLHKKEREEFLEWKRKLALLQEENNLMLTPYEKNLEFWRQLWRVIERSDVIVQIVDARNPLLFRCEDLEKYVKEVGSEKVNVLLINKADFLTGQQRQVWAKYFSEINVKAVFFSATLAMNKEMILEDTIEENIPDNESKEIESPSDTKNQTEGTSQNLEQDTVNNGDHIPPVLNREELIIFFKELYPPKCNSEGILTVGLVGYPNVGKSSTINALMMQKKVSVSTTPGKTKHFQTLYVDENLLLCDCPGLVMPSFVNTKAEMLLNGILPINQMRDHIQPINLIGKLIPRHVIEDLYGIMIPLPREGEDPERSPTSEEILNAHGYNRGFMTQNGQPDNSRSARCILKDFVSGKLLYCVAPPNHEQSEFHIFLKRQRVINVPHTLPCSAKRFVKAPIDDAGFFENKIGIHFKGNNLLIRSAESATTESEGGVHYKGKASKIKKPKKKEKSRRLYAHLDQH